MTSNDAGLAVPDWPLSYGRLMPPMVGGIFYEHGHRMVATFVGMVMVILAVWTGAREARSWVRRLGWLNLTAVAVQGLLGGLTVLYFLPPAISMAHASLAQAFFCITITLAVVTGRGWIEEEALPAPAGAPNIRSLSLWLVGAVYLQTVLGAGNRHNAIGILPHIAGAAGVMVAVIWLAVLAHRHYPGHWARHAALLGTAALLQTTLGVATLLVKNAAMTAVQPLPDRVWSATAHVALGALTLAIALVFALRVCRRFPGSAWAGAKGISRTPEIPGLDFSA